MTTMNPDPDSTAEAALRRAQESVDQVAGLLQQAENELDDLLEVIQDE